MEQCLTTVPWVKVHVLEGLHAKCYLNEKEALVTSINLYDWSTRNVEMGVLVSKSEGILGSFFGGDLRDEELYDDILKHVQEIVDWSDDAPTHAKVTPVMQDHKPSATTTKEKAKQTRRSIATIESGACIRCGTEINADPSKPFCKRHWRYWNKEKYDDYLQEFCHLCGKGHEVTRLRPACYPCYKKYKDAFEFPAA